MRFSRQHLNAAPVFVSAYLLRLQCQSAGSLKTQECIISGGYISCGPRGFNSFTIMSSHLLFCTFFPVQKSLPTTTHEEIVALNLTCFFFLDVFHEIDVKFLPIDHWIERAIDDSKQQTNKDDNIKHIQISDLSSANTYLYCVSHCI